MGPTAPILAGHGIVSQTRPPIRLRGALHAPVHSDFCSLGRVGPSHGNRAGVPRPRTGRDVRPVPGDPLPGQRGDGLLRRRTARRCALQRELDAGRPKLLVRRRATRPHGHPHLRPRAGDHRTAVRHRAGARGPGTGTRVPSALSGAPLRPLHLRRRGHGLGSVHLRRPFLPDGPHGLRGEPHRLG